MSPQTPHLAASLLQHLGIPHGLVNLWEDPDFACDRDREFLMGQQNWGQGESGAERTMVVASRPTVGAHTLLAFTGS